MRQYIPANIHYIKRAINGFNWKVVLNILIPCGNERSYILAPFAAGLFKYVGHFVTTRVTLLPFSYHRVNTRDVNDQALNFNETMTNIMNNFIPNEEIFYID